ncbi:hypothetical protein NLA06_01765 [Desulfomicrobium sp. ZS1]|jgi:hypothetical protein|uniref:hypothetical protein n=1 Tax=Desulfomicrobium sp. ZS1 TaxID=2952228 RepID=UPI0020B1E499|nr:hypothetical protein [Desulfomicrobium sp. ZS1]UTF50638.1 hypothetical protein NLA06_01765 [Desulfomicrobium sp. ZS1]
MNEIVQAEEHRAQGLMTLLAKGLLESSAQRTVSSLGDRSRYIGMSDIGRALECPRAAVGQKLFGNGHDQQLDQHAVQALIGKQLRFQRGHWFEAGVAQVFRQQRLPVIEQLEIVTSYQQVPIKAHLDFVFASSVGQPTVRILELKSCEKLPKTLYSSYETQVYGQVGLLRALWNQPAFGVHGEADRQGSAGLTFPQLCLEKFGIEMPVHPSEVDIEAWVLCLSMSDAKAFGPYLPDDTMLSLCLKTAEGLWRNVDGLKKNDEDFDNLPTAEGFHPLCSWCEFNADCPKFDGLDQPQWGNALDQLKDLKARQDQLDAEISEVEDGLKTAYALSDAFGSWISAGNQRFRVSTQAGRRTLNKDQLRLELSKVLGEDDADALITRCETEGKPFDRLNISKINKRP